ncbi:MAG: prolyl oligopeptidase family serine peptidase, partial [Bacteroidota bacterium]
MPTTQLPRQLVAVLLLAAVLFLPACDTGGTTPEPNTDTIFFGVNYTRLFAEPTAAEIAAVKAGWDARLTQSSGTPKTAGSASFDGAFYGILQHTVSTATGPGDVVHYGVVRIPDGASDFPILVVHHGGDDGLAINAGSANTGVQQWVAAFPQLAASTVQIWPVYRSETITVSGSPIGGETYTAGGDPSPWDYDVDDSIAFLDAVIERWGDFVDENRVAAMGMSRGANTALLHAVRDSRIDAVTNYYGPTDFYGDGAQALATGVLTGNEAVLGLPGAQYLFDTVIDPLRNEDGSYNASADYASAKREVLRRSASEFLS